MIVAVVISWRLGFPIGLAVFLLIDFAIHGAPTYRKDRP